eukprot:3581033-Pyramimonas_sp.AAC.1
MPAHITHMKCPPPPYAPPRSRLRVLTASLRRASPELSRTLRVRPLHPTPPHLPWRLLESLGGPLGVV